MKKLILTMLCGLSMLANAYTAESNKMYTLLVKFTVKPELITEFKEASLKSLIASRKEAGNIEMKFYSDDNNDNVFYVYSRWHNENAYELHKTLPHSVNIASVAKSALVKAPELMVLNETLPIPNHNLKQVNGEGDVIKNWEATGFEMPESVVSDPNSNWLYVSNIVNRKTPGYISRISKSGKVDNYKWIEGLNQPCGLGIYGNKLFVGDQNKVHIIDIKKGKLIKSLSTDGATTLNDVAIGKNGQVFISDIMNGKIYTIENNKLVVWIENAEFKHPNGLYVDNGNLIVADLGDNLNPDASPKIQGSVYKINIPDKSVQLINSSYRLGGLDGVVKVGDKYIVTNNSGGELYAISDKERILLASFTSGIADLGSEGQTIYIPNFAGTVTSFTLSK